MRFQTMLLSFLLAGAGVIDALAETPEATATLESVFIMQVDGWIIIDPQGKVADYQRKTLVPANLVGPIDQTVRAWLFKPVIVRGAPVQAKAKMRITLAAQKVGDVYRVRIDNVTFPRDEAAQELTPDDKPFAVKVLSLKPPRYPSGAAGLSGIVLLGLKIGLDGRVENCVVIQSSLVGKYYGSANLSRVVQALELSATEAVKEWRFTVDVEHGMPTVERLTGTVTISYVMDDVLASLKPGKWHFEERTSKSSIPWLPSDLNAQSVGVSDSSSGEMTPVASAIQLISTPNGTAL